jgi:DNA-binding NarL/FixJ family response regulator
MPGENCTFDERLLGKAVGYEWSPTEGASAVVTDGHPGFEFEIIDSERQPFRFDQASILSTKQDVRSAGSQNNGIEGKLVVIGSQPFLLQCLQRSMQPALSIPILSLSSISLLDIERCVGLIRSVIIILTESNTQECTNAMGILSELAPSVPIVVLASTYNLETMRTVIGRGAKAYIPMTMGFEMTIEALRFVLAGGTYVPAECLLSATPSAAPSSPHPATSGAFTSRELAVVRAIQQGKSNKIIAYDLNMCESTVKVHVRNIMKKLQAKNRTHVAIKAIELLSPSVCTG